MKIVVITEEALRQELLLKPVREKVEYIWINQIGAIENYLLADAVVDLEFKPAAGRITALARFLPKPVLINSVVINLTEINPGFIRINAWPGFLKRNICEIAVFDERGKAVADLFFKELGWEKRFVPDQPGLVSPRIIASLVNEAYYTLGAGVSNKEQIDIAMKLGTNYPFGPFEWSEKIGLEKIYALLGSLSRTDKRYEASEAMLEDLNGVRTSF
jgi:3-hydroxybutyryl-CoA dehydrogenase